MPKASAPKGRRRGRSGSQPSQPSPASRSLVNPPSSSSQSTVPASGVQLASLEQLEDRLTSAVLSGPVQGHIRQAVRAELAQLVALPSPPQNPGVAFSTSSVMEPVGDAPRAGASQALPVDSIQGVGSHLMNVVPTPTPGDAQSAAQRAGTGTAVEGLQLGAGLGPAPACGLPAAGSGLGPDSGGSAVSSTLMTSPQVQGSVDALSHAMNNQLHAAQVQSGTQNVCNLPIVNNQNVPCMFAGGVGELAPASAPLPLDYSVSTELRDKIWAHIFFEFGDLLNPTKAAEMKLVVQKGGETGDTSIGVIQGGKKQPKSIEDWMTAFAIFTTVYVAKYPAEASQLLKHSETVRMIAAQGGDFNYYDTGFRRLRQKARVPFDMFHNELYTKSFRQTPMLGTGGTAPKSANQSTGGFPYGYCFRFHSGQSCNESQCPYYHRCFRCRGRHPIHQCWQRSGAIRSNFSGRPPYSPGISSHSNFARYGGVQSPGFNDAYRGGSGFSFSFPRGGSQATRRGFPYQPRGRAFGRGHPFQPPASSRGSYPN